MSRYLNLWSNIDFVVRVCQLGSTSINSSDRVYSFSLLYYFITMINYLHSNHALIPLAEMCGRYSGPAQMFIANARAS